ncbi:hypothetical protein HG531_008191 [Fusarium graminearum]|nr:hypothetical protein HG531_008191 [Fusarium graminearum]
MKILESRTRPSIRTMDVLSNLQGLERRQVDSNGDAIHIDSNLSDARIRNESRLDHLALGSLLVHFALDTVVNSVEDVLDGDTRLVSGLSALLVHAGLDKNAVPIIVGDLVDGVGTTDVTLRGITNKVDSVGRSDETMLSLAPLAHQTGSKFKSRNLRLAKGMCMQNTIAASEVLKGHLEHTAKGTHAETDMLVSSRPDNVVVGEVERGALVVGLAAVSLTGVAVLLRGKLAERSGGSVVLDDVAWSHDIFEAIALGNMSTLLAFTTDDKNCAVLLSHFPHGGMAADELARLDITLELTGEVVASLLFSLSTTVGKEDMRPKKIRGWWIVTAYGGWFDLHLNAIFILAIENLHGLEGLRNGSSTTNKDTVNVKSKDKGVSHRLRNSRGEGRGGRSETGNAVTGAGASKLRRARDRVGSGDLAVVREVVLEKLGLL